jgi:hypothetical protein
MKPLVRADDISPPGGVEPAGKACCGRRRRNSLAFTIHSKLLPMRDVRARSYTPGSAPPVTDLTVTDAARRPHSIARIFARLPPEVSSGSCAMDLCTQACHHSRTYRKLNLGRPLHSCAIARKSLKIRARHEPAMIDHEFDPGESTWHLQVGRLKF